MHWTEAQYHLYLARQSLARQQHPRAPAPPAPDDLPEAKLLRQVRALAQRQGFAVYHTLDSRGSDEGFPDLVMTNGRRVIFAELKSRTGKLTAQQAVWLALLKHTNSVEAYCWRTGEWPAILACLEPRPASLYRDPSAEQGQKSRLA